MRIQISGVAPKALERRMAMSGDTPAWPLMRRERVVRLTPSAFAPAVTDRPNGSRQLSRTDSPGCGGFFMGMGVFSFSLVVVDEIDSARVAILQAENNPPVRPHSNRPEAFPRS